MVTLAVGLVATPVAAPPQQSGLGTGAGLAIRLPGTGAGIAETLEAIERAGVVTRVLYVTAHPDDESSSILTYLARGLHAEVGLLSLTRGEGGQNALGPEQAPQLGVIRTAELQRATRQYGVRLFFTRAADFGYSKTAEETLRIWGDAARDDIVAVLLHFRPHLIINNWGGVRGGHGQHQAAGLLVPRAVEEAAKRDGTWVWDGVPIVNVARTQQDGAIAIPSDEISPLWGESYNAIGLEGFVNHRTQGIVGFRGSRFFRGRRSLLAQPNERKFVEELLKPRVLTDYFQPVKGDSHGVPETQRLIDEARDAVAQMKWQAAAAALADAGRRVNGLLQKFGVNGQVEAEDAREARQIFELTELAQRVNRALSLVAGLRLEASADRSELVAGEKFTVTVTSQRRAEVPLDLSEAELVMPDGWRVAEKAAEERGEVRFTVQIPADAKAARSENEWMHPWPAALVRARLSAKVDGYEFAVEEDVTAQRVTSTRVDELPLTLAPAVTLTPEPRQFVVAQNQPQKPLELVARVRHYGRAAADVTVALEAPAEWRVSQGVRVRFEGAGDQLVKFTVTPPRAPPVGSFPLKLVAHMAKGAAQTRGGEEFRTSLEPLATLPTRLWSEPAVANVRVFDVAVPRGLRVGYVAAENDPIPAALRQLGIEVTMLDEAALAFGDLARFDAIAIGIRAYELREDLIRSNRRLLDYCAAGGTLVVQYQRDGIWNRMNPAPYAATVGDPTLRVAVEDAPVRMLAPEHALLNLPNRISTRDFEGWLQERGLYFWGQFDARYTPLLGMNDPGEEETTGSLVVTQHGRGLYVYTGLSFFRQLPEGVPGAYRLFVNLLSQKK